MLRCLILLVLVLGTHQVPQTTRITNEVDLTPARPTSPTPCETDEDKPGFCVLYYQCKKNKVINVDGEDIIEARIKECPFYLEKCCELPDVSPEKTPPPVPPPTKKGCGWRNPNGISISVPQTDGEAGFAEFPWMVVLLKSGQQFGAGSLIHPSAVLTSALAAREPGLTARAGDWDLSTTREIYPHQDREVASAVVHEQFIKETLYYNIGLLFLSKPMELAPNVGVMCLPPPDETPEPGTRCFTSGWGKKKFDEAEKYAVLLKKVEVPVVPPWECVSKLRGTRLGGLFELHSSFMCAGGERGVDTCKGDGGAPLVCPIPGEKERYYQSGIVAWGVGCGADGVPGVYTDVRRQRAWIDDKMSGKQFDLSVYNSNAFVLN